MNRRTFLTFLPSMFFSPAILRYLNLSEMDSIFCEEDKLIFKKEIEFAKNRGLFNEPIGKLITEIAKSFVGVKYMRNPIEPDGEERLVVNLRSFDCVTLCESALVIARCIKKEMLEFDEFVKELEFVRYRNGVIDGYASRLHYTTDYFFNNQEKGVLKDITKEINGVQFRKKINFMSENAKLYPKLNKSKKNLEEIKKVEIKINNRKIYYIPKNQISKISGKIQDGDIIGIATFIKGLDCSHTGIAIWLKGKLHMIHASIYSGKVEITDCTLKEYVNSNSRNAGIIVARPLEVKETVFRS